MAQPFVLAAFVGDQVAIQSSSAAEPLLVDATKDGVSSLASAIQARAAWHLVLPASVSTARVEDVSTLSVRADDAIGAVRLQLPRDYFSADTPTRFVGHLSRNKKRRLAYAGQVATKPLGQLTSLINEAGGRFIFGIHPGFALAALLGNTGTSIAFGIGENEIVGLYHDNEHTIIDAVEASSPARLIDFATGFIAAARKEARPDATVHALVFSSEVDPALSTALDRIGVHAEIARDTEEQLHPYPYWLLAGLRLCVERKATLPALWVLPSGETPTLRDYAPLFAGAFVGALVFIGYLFAAATTTNHLSIEQQQYSQAQAQTARLSADLGSHVARNNGIAAALAYYRNSGPRYASAIMALGNAAVENGSWASTISFNGSTPSITFNTSSLERLAQYQTALARLGYTLPWGDLNVGTLPHSVSTTISKGGTTAPSAPTPTPGATP